VFFLDNHAYNFPSPKRKKPVPRMREDPSGEVCDTRDRIAQKVSPLLPGEGMQGVRSVEGGQDISQEVFPSPARRGVGKNKFCAFCSNTADKFSPLLPGEGMQGVRSAALCTILR
jgi:hypothetical protein